MVWRFKNSVKLMKKKITQNKFNRWWRLAIYSFPPSSNEFLFISLWWICVAFIRCWIFFFLNNSWITVFLTCFICFINRRIYWKSTLTLFCCHFSLFVCFLFCITLTLILSKYCIMYIFIGTFDLSPIILFLLLCAMRKRWMPPKVKRKKKNI